MALVPYTSPLDIVFYPVCAFLFCVIGFAFFATFIVSEMTTAKAQKNIFRELTLALIASMSLGLGLFFVLLAGGIYV
ncbi:UPF0197 transmembrane protein [Dictyostelium discoideum AX4]|uniref:Dolichyl-diphosphooligosaccharide--protein glycosyltransferase subunit OST5 n=1 Tax=Dictyostelium discoideum TaxID=44689 RepID=OST5_DICDI|nr:UPF0197 transmembrane protein [Dictyostelium discoideum AX4]Q54J38.1 RecName: Full=Dolichyl-diphosphooligosaccharide--protein glycosyltransferase subunit OST5; Short=Oligosaccharyl transferase subunit OST5; AltName: Full=Transmembrane protein 258 homolog [Dictyostelium discoideum]EAL63259.1 UPF0197 transmembrane protein [Dictyostelium discoideum AX4]|eukprot:XP_636763.1 UPF0197 transmembrane protein [Dictyostelium discoideum AX4]